MEIKIPNDLIVYGFTISILFLADTLVDCFIFFYSKKYEKVNGYITDFIKNIFPSYDIKKYKYIKTFYRCLWVGIISILLYIFHLFLKG